MRLLENNDITVERLSIAMFSEVFALFGLAALAFVWPNTAKAFVAMENIFDVIDTQSEIDVRSKDGFIPGVGNN